MAVYGALFTLAAILAFAEQDQRARRASNLFMFGLCLFATLVIGTRWEVGADWPSYLGMLDLAAHVDFGTLMLRSDPGYMVLNWIAARAEVGIWLVNTICAAILASGLYVFCKGRPYPLLTFLVAVPYLLIVVGMGYTRQAAAIGFFLMAITRVERGSVFKFLAWTFAAALFHKSAVMVAPLGILAVSRNRLMTLLACAAILPLAYVAFLAEHMQRLSYIYLDKEYSSSGAMIRLLISAIAGAIFLAAGRRLKLSDPARKFWKAAAWASILLFLALPVSPSSTALDRVALFLIPLQMLVFGSAPSVIHPPRLRPLTSCIVISAYAVVFLVWLLMGNNASAWLPYQSVLQ